MVVAEERCGRPLLLNVAACQTEVEVKDLVKISFDVKGSHPSFHTVLSLVLCALWGRKIGVR